MDSDTVNELVRQGKEKAYKKGYQTALEEFSQKEENRSEPTIENKGSQSIQRNSTSSDFDENRYRSMIAEEMRKLHEEEAKKQEQKLLEDNARRLFSELHQKVEDSKSRYPDYDEVTKVLNVQEIPEILAYANEADNAGDVLYDLAKNPSKIATLRSLPPQLAISEIHRLSNSIKTNQKGNQEASQKPPLQQLKPTSVNHGDGPLTLRDFKKIYTV
ncbi:hypothetical protein [Flavobacterium sp.]|uniref:hypothetical protein n=1 Tax=Flavobacterium sp. TaxID=239 RepID=UPI003F697D89